MPNFNEVTRDFIEYPIYYYDVTYSMSLPVRGIGGAAGVIMNGWDPVNLAPSLVHVSAAGELSISGSISAQSSAKATVAAPSYIEGSTNALSSDLAGALRVTGTINASSTVKSTAAAPTYVEGSNNPFSSDLAGNLRVTGAFFQTTQPVSLASLPNSSNLDVALSTRTKPSDQQHVIIDSAAGALAVTGTFFQGTQPVSGPVTDTQLRATPVPVSGTVTATTGGLTDTQLRATAVPVSGTLAVTSAGLTNLDVALSTRTKPSDQQHVIIDSSAALAVTGTFFQVTQPVSLATNTPDVTDRAARLLGHVTVDNASLAVTGTFFQATQPVSGPLTDTQLRASAVPVSGTFFQATQPVSVAAAVTVTQAAITKGTQGSTGVTTQDLKDAGRSARTITLDSFAVAATGETIMTMSYSTDNGTLTTGTSYSVTSAKRLRIQSIIASLHTITGNTTAVNVIARIRVNNGGAALVSSPVQMVFAISGIAAANGASPPVLIDFPDGWEFVAGAGIAVTLASAGFVATTAAPKVDLSIIGYEY